MKLSDSVENVCAVIAVVDQESSFEPNPRVLDLGKTSVNALKSKFAGWSIMGEQMLEFLEQTPSAEDSFMDRILRAKTERDLDLTYRSIVKSLTADSGLSDLLTTRFLADLIENQNDIRTIGSMQVSVDFAVSIRRKILGRELSLVEIHKLRDELYTRKGGMKYGALQLLGYNTGYDRKIYRFADYNAGRYSSRNAAFQFWLTRIVGQSLSLDGDLLSYNSKGVVEDRTTNTEQVALKATSLYKFGLSPKKIREDLSKSLTEKGVSDSSGL